MEEPSKLKPIEWSKITINSILSVVTFFAAFAVIRAVTTETTADRISGIIYTVITAILLISWFRTRAVIILPGMLMNLVIAVYFFTHARTAAILINVILLIIAIYMLYVHLKHHSIYRKILELAAGAVTNAENGFTQRSYPAGKTTYSKGELLGFAEFLKKRLIAVPFFENNAVVFVLAEDWFGYLLNLHQGYEKVTRITFDYDGNVSTFVARSDYSKYKEALTFDQLCASFGRVFTDFLQDFRNGELDKILIKIN